MEVNYTPGVASPSPAHARSAFIHAYVIPGAIGSKVNDGETRICRAGESWSEPPNASKTEPTKPLAVLVVDTDDKALTKLVK